MATNYVLVDFENVQPDSLAALATGQFRVKVFVGAAQAKGRISFELSHSMQMLGANAEYVKIARTGKNAVDMHIAYYVGRLLEKEPGAVIHIISKDSDFDPLIEYLRAKGSSCKRVKTITEVPKHAAPRPAATVAKTNGKHPTPAPSTHVPSPRRPHAEKLAPIIKHLHSLSGKPATSKKLTQTIATYFKQHGGALGDKTVALILDELVRLKYVSQDGTKVSYHLS
ncbi:MAG TPA: PIN domain-containing protein [Steroidobacteraceae bacterium]|nr:PIN domain-containing protein [Steroidobacteraceae bacterium]